MSKGGGQMSYAFETEIEVRWIWRNGNYFDVVYLAAVTTDTVGRSRRKLLTEHTSRPVWPANSASRR